MPDDTEGGAIAESADAEVPTGNASVLAEIPPDPPNAQAAESVGEQSMEGKVEELEDRVKKAEIWMIGLTAAIALFALCSIVVGILQWNVMKGQLKVMQDGGTDTHNLAIAAGNQATWTQRLSDNMGDQAKWTHQFADDNGQLLRGTQGALMDFSLDIDVFRSHIRLTGRDSGRVPAQQVHADLAISVRNWQTQKTILGPFNRPVDRDRIGQAAGPYPPLEENYVIPNVTPEIADDLSKGRAYIAVDWQASYDDGFNHRVFWPANGKRVCEAMVYLGSVVCPKIGERGFDIRSTCRDIKAAGKTAESAIVEAQKQGCQKQDRHP